MEALAPIAAQLGLDQSFYSLFGLMFVLYLLMSSTFLIPYQKLIEERRSRIEGTKKESTSLSSAAEKKQAEFHQKQLALNERSKALMVKELEAARREEASLLSEANQKSKEVINDTQRQLEQQRQGVVSELSTEISILAEMAASKVLGR